MHNYEEIRNYLQSTANVIEMDIGLVGADRTILMGTGQYGQKIGTLRPRGCYFFRTIKTGEEFLVRDPRQKGNCLNCEAQKNCQYSVVLCAPIRRSSEVVGVVGLLGYKTSNAESILTKHQLWEHYIREIAQWLSRHTIVPSALKIRGSLEDTIESLLNVKKQGLIIADEKLGIIKINKMASDLLGGIDEGVGKKINEIIPPKIITPLLDKEIGQISFKPQNNKASIKLTLNSTEVLGINNGVAVIISSAAGKKELNSHKGENGPEPTVLKRIIGFDKNIIRVKKLIKHVAPSEAPALIIGDTGTGKELVAQAIHGLSSRRANPLICINCATISETLAESELFGYEGGAFTGAKANGRKGKFELADQGSIFLDEIEALSLAVQGKLLRVLEEKKFYRVGGTSPISTNVRIIAATNVALEPLIRSKMFREDLYFRLNVIPIRLPLLSDRIADIPVLARHLLHEYCSKHHTVLEDFSPEVMDIFIKYRWPGNVRQLRNVVEYLGTMVKHRVASERDLPYYLTETPATSKNTITADDIDYALLLFGTDTEGKKKAAKYLGISLPTLYRKIKKSESDRRYLCSLGK